jgi:hypothetical protein
MHEEEARYGEVGAEIADERAHPLPILVASASLTMPLSPMVPYHVPDPAAGLHGHPGRRTIAAYSSDPFWVHRR